MNDTHPKTFVFVLMPFSDEFKDIYEVGIKPACKDAGAYCERVDEQIFVENILERIYNQLAKADVVIAEMTGRNPNVFYETGYAHALNKRVILLTQNAGDIPFDLKHYPHIVYGGKIATLKSQLEARVRWCVDNPKSSLSNVEINLQLFINGLALINKPELSVTFKKISVRGTEYGTLVDVNIHNLTNKVLSADTFNLSVIVPKTMRATNHYKKDNVSFVTDLQDGKAMYRIKQSDSLFPDGWVSSPIVLGIKEEDLVQLPVEIILRVFTELGPKDYPFTLRQGK